MYELLEASNPKMENDGDFVMVIYRKTSNEFSS